MKYIIRDNEAGNYIDERDTLNEAEQLLKEFEEQDKADGNYKDNFYEIIEKEV